jgi:hypothetical protein
MSISVDQSLLERALAILRESDDYRDLKQDLDEYFPDDSWANTADSSGPFANAFTRNVEDEDGWLPQADLSTFWEAVERVADPEHASSSDDLHGLLREMIEAWQNAASAPAADEPAEFQSVTEMPGDNYVGWQQGYDPVEQVWKYRDPADGFWRETQDAFPPAATGSGIFSIGERMFVSDGTAESQVWPYPDIADTYYDADQTYDLMGNVIPPVTEDLVTEEPVTEEPVTEEPVAEGPGQEVAEADSGAADAELERELRELFEVPPDAEVWVSPA